MVDVALYIRYAKVAQAKDYLKIAQQWFLKGSTLVPDYTRLLEIVRKSVEYMYANNPNEPTLDQVANYMYNLSGKRNLTPTTSTSPFRIIIHPVSQTVNAGANVTFTVVVAGGTAPYSYQWFKNGVELSGETSVSLNLTNVDSGDAGSYTCEITDSASGDLTSNAAILTVNAAVINGFFSYGDVDPNTDLQAHVDNFTYQAVYFITHNNPISIPVPLAGSVNKFVIAKVPSTESDKTTWGNGQFNFGTIPDSVFRSLITFGGYDFYYTRVAASFDISVPLILT